MKIKSFLIGTLLLFSVYSCNLLQDGKIDNRGDSLYKRYLVNTSSSERIVFTVKLTATLLKRSDESLVDVKYITNTYTLEPGGELELNPYNTAPNYNDANRYIYKYEIVGERVDQ